MVLQKEAFQGRREVENHVKFCWKIKQNETWDLANKPSHMEVPEKYNKGDCWKMLGESPLKSVEEKMEGEEVTMSADNYL